MRVFVPSVRDSVSRPFCPFDAHDPYKVYCPKNSQIFWTIRILFLLKDNDCSQTGRVKLLDVVPYAVYRAISRLGSRCSGSTSNPGSLGA